MVDTGGSDWCRRCEFYQLLLRLERAAAAGEEGGAANIGGLEPANEAVRLRPHLSFASARSAVESIESVSATMPANDSHPDNPGDAPHSDALPPRVRWRVDVNFFGLYGTDSPLPTHFTEQLLQDGPGATAVRSVFDVLNHRLYSLLFRAWKKYRYFACFRPNGKDEISQMLTALIGLGTAGLREQAAKSSNLGAVHMLRYGGLLTHRPRSAAVIQGVLTDHFANDRVRLRQFVERRLTLPDSARTFLGGRRGGDEQPAIPVRTLGPDTIVGRSRGDRSSRIRISIGPLRWRRFIAFLPGGEDRAILDELVRRTAPAHVDHEVELILGHRWVPCRLGGRRPPLLGWTAFLPSPSQTGGHHNRSVLFRPGPAPTEPSPRQEVST